MRGRIQSAGAAVVCALAISLAQDFGSVTGKVTDPSGAAIPGASVELFSSKTNFKKETKTDIAGAYRFLGVPLGEYTVTVQSLGFQIFRAVVTVHSNASTICNGTLQVGAIAETVEVNASAVMVNASSAQISQTGSGRVPARGIRVRRFRFNTEQYDYFQENEFAEVRRNPLSTFSADVDTASYSNVRRLLSQGEMPPPDAVRIEELINYFSYDYPDPRVGEPFSITTSVLACPWKPDHRLIHIGMRTRTVETASLPPANLVFLIDVSGSMDMPNKLPLVKQSLRLLAEQLREQDRVAIAVYAGAAGMVLAPTPGSEKSRIIGAIDSLNPGGSTNGAEGIRLAYQLARQGFIRGGNNRVILSTDGDFNVGVSSDGELVRLIERERDTGVFLSVLGFGMGNLKDGKMEKLADHGNGNYAYIDNLREARKVLVEQMSGTLLTVAKDVKLQVEFNPARVSAYRLIGYENRVLRPEEFNDDKKDAGDMGAGTSVTAIYEVIPAGVNEEVAGIDPLRYQKTGGNTAASRTRELATVKFRYKPPAENTSRLLQQAVMDSRQSFDEASNDARFAIAVAEYGLVLRRSKFAGNASLDHVIAVASQALGHDRNGYRAEFVGLVKTAQSLLRGGGALE